MRAFIESHGTPEALRCPLMAFREPRRLLSSTPFQSSSGECRIRRGRVMPKTRSWTFVGLCLGAAALISASGSSLVSYAAEPSGSAAERGEEPSSDAGSSGNLSERLNRSGGVIKPPADGDPESQKKPPDTSRKIDRK